MARKKGHEEAPHIDERWLLTYADMITLLLALFIVLFSMSSISAAKFHTFSMSLAQAFNVKISGDSILDPGASPDSQTITPTADLISLQENASKAKQQEQNAQAAARSLSEQLQSTQSQLSALERATHQAEKQANEKRFAEIRAKVMALVAKSSTLRSQVQVRVDGRGLVLRVLPDKVLFASGSAQLRPEASTLLDPLAMLLKGQPNSIRVEGHTDSQPIHTVQFPSNWELSGARADSVVRYFIGHGVPPRRLSAAGFADTQPVGSNATTSGRAQNRRIEIIVLRSAS